MWLLGMTQAINLIDGLDGLAAGIVGDRRAARSSSTACDCSSASGCCRRRQHRSADRDHHRRHVRRASCRTTSTRRKIFMGDGGALLLGLLLAVSDQRGRRPRRPEPAGLRGQTYFFLAPLFIPLFILGVPILDTLFAIVRRATRRQGVATADKGHLHHR